jgi:hypothetical protein
MDEFRTMVPIKGFPMYLIDSESLKVISFHKTLLGCERVLERDDSGKEGYTLYQEGSSKFFSKEDLRGTVELHKIKLALKDKEEMTKVGIPVTGDFLVGSLSKLNGAMSFSAFPGKHADLLKARTEAARLAGIDKTKKFVVVEVKAIASANDINWE